MPPDLQDTVAVGERLYHFHGGLHLRHHKKISCEQPVTRPPLPERLVLPLRQHAGLAAEAVVEAGQQVLKGQLLARARGALGLPLHAPTSGTIEALRPHRVPSASALPEPCVMLLSDGQDQWGDRHVLEAWQQASPAALVEHLHNMGVAGLGGAAFPTHVKLGAGLRQAPLQALILNGAECEPYISCDEMLMRERADEIITGGLILQRGVSARQLLIAIEDQMGAVARILRKALKKRGLEQAVEVVKVTTIYPEGGERQLIQVLTGREVPADGLPTDLGLLVQNVGTAAAAKRAVEDGEPLIERYVTVTGPGVRQPANFNALLGTPMAELVAAAGGYTDGAARLIMGGPVMGIALPSDALPVVKASNCILVLDQAAMAGGKAVMPCINCGECVRVCPAQLLPQTLYQHIRAADYERVENLALADCIECGCCDLVCPSHIPLVDYFRHGKGELARQAMERRQSDWARQRYDARQARLARLQAEREAQRQAKRAALDNQRDKQAEISAAIERVKTRRQEQTPAAPGPTASESDDEPAN